MTAGDGVRSGRGEDTVAANRFDRRRSGRVRAICWGDGRMSADRGAAPDPADHAHDDLSVRLHGSQPDGEVTALPIVPRPRAAPVAQPVFIHSSWRTSSTWFWLKFREKTSTLCYYEPFHEILTTLTRDRAQSIGPASWTESRHPPGGPYFLEFRPLIRRAGGVRLYTPEIAYEWFMPEGGVAGNLRPPEARYVGLLLRHAGRHGKIPVFGFTRSLGRLAALKRRFGGVHIFLYRNLWTQWASYVGQNEAGNRYFLETILRVLLQAQDRFFAASINRCLVRAVARGLPAPSADAGLAARLLDTLSEAELFGLFMALHLYLYVAAQASADLSIDATRLARDRHYRETTAARLAEMTGLAIDLADVKDVAHAHWAAPDGIDWQEIRESLDFAGLALDHLYSREELARGGERLIAETLAEIQTGERYLARPRAAIARLDSDRTALAVERDALRSDLERLAGEREAALAERAAIERERAAALAERDGVAQQRDAVLIERDKIARALQHRQQERDAALAERDIIAQQRDAALAERDEIARESHHRQQERDAAVAERDVLRIQCDRIEQERSALAAASAELARERDAVAAERDQLARDRSAMAAELLRLSGECEAAAQQRDVALAELAHRRERTLAVRLRRLLHRQSL
jgi:hypothetical protein